MVQAPRGGASEPLEDTMSGPFVLAYTFKIKDGKLDDAKKAFESAFEIIEANEPRMLGYYVWFDESTHWGASVQIHPDSASAAFHLNVIAPQCGTDLDWYEAEGDHLILGADTDGVVEAMRAWEPQSLVSVPSYVHGFTR